MPKWDHPRENCLIACLMLLLGVCPVTLSNRLRLSVEEGQPPETVVGDISVALPSEASTGGYFISEGEESVVLRDLKVDGVSGVIKTARVLDRETRDRYQFVAVTVSGHMVTVEITVTDINDHSPVFPRDTVQLNISELTPNGTRFRLEPAWDPDTGIFSVQSYAITAGNPGLFQLRPGNGLTRVELVLGGLLDRENREYYSLTVQASDGGTPPRTGTMQLVVRVLDENDNPPRFERTEYEAWVREDAVPGTRIIRLQASDPDQGTNGFVTYEIDRRRSGPSGRFAIESRSGEVRLRGPLDRERRPRYQLVIRACDHGSPAGLGSAFLSVRLLDVNDNRPSISIVYLSPSGRAEVSEGAAPGQPVARVSVGDPDLGEGGELRVWLHDDIEGPSGGGSFELRHTPLASIFLLSVNRRLDRERRRAHHLTVLASDSARPPLTSRCSLQLHVADVNDNAPAFEREVYEAHVAEGPLPASIRAPLLQVSARDPDAGANGTVRYAILAEGAPPVRVDPLTGWISAAACLDRESHEVIRLSVVARDLGEPPLSSTVSVLLHVDDVNDNEPAFEQQLYTATVREHTEPGTCFLQVNARDADAGLFGTIHYFLYDDVNNYEKSHLFTIDSSSGQICTTQNMDRDNGPPSYDLLVIAEDGGGLSAQSFIHLDLQDINDNQPLFNPLTYVTSISSHTQPGTEITNVMASDRDSGVNGKVSYELLTGNFSSLFSVDSSTGAVYLTSTFSHLQVSDVQLKISARDGGNLTSSLNATVTVHILQSSVAPTVFEQSSYSFTILESVPIGSAVGRVQVASIQDSLELKYRISSGDPNGYFSIESKSGLIRSNKQLDHEAQPFVMLTIESQTSSSPVYSYVQVNITIIDVNDNAPAFHQESEIITISKNTLPGTVLYIAHAEDKDSGLNGIIMYSLQNDYEQTFSIDYVHGTLYLNRTVFSKKKQYSIHILASDHGAQPLSTVFMLLVNVDHLDGNLTFETLIYEVEVSEAAPFNMRILQVHAHMQDSKVASGLVYSLQQNLDSLTFGIHAASGWIYIHKALDYEKKHSYSFKVFATNPKEHLKQSAIASVIVNVMDENDNPPLFTQNLYFFTIEESPIPQGLVGKVQATDQDSGKNSHLSFILLSDGKFFRLNSKTGEIINWVALDREQHIHHQLSVLVTDHGVPRQNASTTIYITVSDINDNRPLFSYPGPSREFFIKVLVAQPEGTFLTTLIAKDPDVGKNGTVSFSILENYSNSFKIDAKTGELRTAKVFMYNYISHHKIVVMASDAGSPPLHQIAEINIQVIPRVIEKLTIHNNQRYFTIPEGLRPGNVVGSISSYDHHLLTSQRIHYYIDEDDDHFPFEVDRMTGELYQSNELDYEEIPHYLLKVIEEDNSHILSRNISIFVSIKIEDQNDHSPWFKDDVVVIGIEENLPVGSLVHIFNAKDDDGSRPNSELRYSVMSWSSTENPFYIDPYQGCLNTTLPVDHEMTKTFLLTITAMDQALNVNERKVGSVTAQIIVLDVNDNKPIFLSENVSYVMEDEEVGYLVHHIIAYDADAGESGRILYAIISGNEDNTFKLDESSGLLTLVSHLDHEIQKSYTLTISGWDNGFPIQSSTQILMVVVVDINDEAPKFQDSVYEIGVPENLNVDAYVVKVEAFDGDSDLNSALIYEILPGSGYDAFKINPQTGIITTTQVLDREIQEYFVIKVLVRDSGTPSLSDTSTVMVTVLDENDHQPEFMPHLHELHISENMDPGIIYALTALDKDAGKNGLVRYEIIGTLVLTVTNQDYHTNGVTYSIFSGNENEAFHIDSKTGEIVVNDSKFLDYEVRTKMHLVLLAKNNRQTAYSQLTILIEDVNDNQPHFQQNYYKTSIWEGQTRNTYVMQVFASDSDHGLNGQIEYSIISGNENKAFVIDSARGIITTNAVLDREVISSYRLVLQAADRGSPRLSITAIVGIQVLDVNDNAPSIPPLKAVQIFENLQAGYVVTQILASDLDLNPVLSYNFTKNGNPEGKFAIDCNTGAIILTEPLDYEKQSEYLVKIKISDSVHETEAALGVYVMDLNDNSPVFSQESYQIVFPELSPVNTYILTVSATDKDTGVNGKVSYRILPGTSTEFYINAESGALFTRRTVHYTSYNSVVQLLVEAKDDGNPALKSITSVEIRIQDINNHIPQFNQAVYNISVNEEAATGIILLLFSTLDQDWTRKNAYVDYIIIGGNEQNKFHIENTVIKRENQYSVVGKLLLKNVLDRELTDSYHLVVCASDRGNPSLSSTTIVSITVLDFNDNPPVFNSLDYHIEVLESTPVKNQLIQVSAYDQDQGANADIRYNIISGNEKEYFRLDHKTGFVELKLPLDYEQVSKFMLTIQAIDGSVTNQKMAISILYINVLDDNDNVPYFVFPTLNCAVNENEPIYTSVCAVHAFDNDDGAFGYLTYSILTLPLTDYSMYTSWNNFIIDPVTGDIYTKQLIDYEQQKKCIFVVQAKDKGNASATATIQVHIQSIDEYEPTFTQDRYYFTLPNLVEVGQKTGQVTAVDKDAGLDGIVQFSFLKPSPYFSLNQTSGVIYVSGSIHNIRGSYKGEEVIDLVIKASSPLMGSKSAISTVAINISQSLDALIGKSTDHLTLSLSVSFVIFLLLSVCCGGLVYRYKAKDKNNSSFGKQNIKLPIISTIINHLNHPVVSSGHQKVNDKQRGKTPVNSPEQLSLVDIPVKTKSFSSSRQCIADGQTAEDREIMMFSANQHSRNQVPESSKPGWTYSVPDSEHTKESYCLSCQLCQNNTTDAVINRESVGSIYNFKDIREEEGFNVDFIDDDVSRNIQNPSIKKNSVMMDNAKNHIFIMDGRTSLIESLNSLVPIQDQIQNSYNYDYVLTWKPGFQPLASAFTEIAKLKDENVLKPVIKNESKSTLPPPLITSIAQQGIRVVPPQMPIVKFNPSTLKYSSLPVATNTYSSTSAITSNFSPSVSVQTPSASTGLSSGIPELTLRQSSHKQKLEENTDVITLSN
ncbi:protocadherin-23 isoform X2 [Chiloscyllium plagiosum]|uniref:protocadherin-23 isoform X2 n=1 Tax=Chiloscyllium plagiosum TaxID=36176 RepID=UPI001CB88174|nr:protocadherin-23 isoform X2 [Chiloscyllium plagiosum]